MKAQELLYNVSKVYQNRISGTHFSSGETIWPYAYPESELVT